MWRMPLYQHYTEQIESDVADLRNTGKKRYGWVNRDAVLFCFNNLVCAPLNSINVFFCVHGRWRVLII